MGCEERAGSTVIYAGFLKLIDGPRLGGKELPPFFESVLRLRYHHLGAIIY